MYSNLKPSDLHSSHDGNALELLSFRLGAVEYGVAIQHVQELRSYSSVTAIANTPAYMKGVINLRGAIVPILDLRVRFGLGQPSYDHLTVVIIFCVGDRQVGAVVDSVSDVVVLEPSQVKPMPSMAAAMDEDYVTGMGALDERMIILVDIDRLLSASLDLQVAAVA